MLFFAPVGKDVVSAAGVTLAKQSLLQNGAVKEGDGLVVFDARDFAQLGVSNRLVCFQEDERRIHAARERLLRESRARVS